METTFDCKVVPVAIIGMGCNLPGKVRSPKQFWDLIMSKRIANVTKVPEDRFNMDSYLHSSSNRAGSFNVSGGYFLDDPPREFDPSLFDISSIEAAWMDPQQRKLLEVVYEAIESSGSSLEEVGRFMTGCYAASFSNDFQQMTLKEPDYRHPYAGIGADVGLLSNRVSHVFNLRGPSITLNTACSSSMHALHLACNAIRHGECEAAVVGGTNLILAVDQQMNTAAINVLSPTNVCHTFDEAADGYGRAEGVGALYIKRLDLALKNGDPIRAVIRSTALNSNGKVPDVGIIYPGFQGQSDVMAAAYKMSGLDPALTGYVECHGTGTAVGDPVEVRAVAATMRSQSTPQSEILIGSVKPNVGHSEASSSISTVIKAVLTVESGIIPPTAGIERLSTKINWSGLQVKVVTDPTPFPTNVPIRRIGINASGYGGTNSHAIIENVNVLVPNYSGHKFLYQGIDGPAHVNGHSKDQNRPFLLVFSAHDMETLRKNVNAHAQMKFSSAIEPPLLDLAYTLARRRTKLACRTYAICRKDSYSDNVERAIEKMYADNGPATVALIFTGQGAQWPQMGAHLLRLYPTFLKSIRDLDQFLSTLSDPPSWKIEEELCAPSAKSRVHEAELSQPLCTAIQIALVDLLRSWQIRPVATAGHSSGEIAAAYAAGLISANYAISVAYYRGKIVSSVKSPGAMLAVGMGASDVLPYIKLYDGKVVIACHNSPSSTTISGDLESIHDLNDRLVAQKKFSRLVHTGGKAYHSHHMRNAARKYEQQLINIACSKPESSQHQRDCVMISSVTGEAMDDVVPDSIYWAKNLESPVLFQQAVDHMFVLNPSINVVVEVGPHSALSGPFRQICNTNGLRDVSYLSCLRRGEDDSEQLLKLAGDLWAREAYIDLESVVEISSLTQDGCIRKQRGKFLTDLPPYQWNYKKDLWLESRNSKEHRNQKHPRHDILGRRVLGLSNLESSWRNVLRHQDLPWLKDHSMGGEAVFPAAAYFAMAIEAVTQLNSDSPFPQEISSYTLRDVALSVALVIENGIEGVETLFSMRRATNEPELAEEGISKKWYSWTVLSNSYGSWKEHGRGTIAINKRTRGQAPKVLPDLPIHNPFQLWIQRLNEFSCNYGKTFQNIFDVRSDHQTHAITADIVIKQECGVMEGESRYAIHPVSIDSCLQLLPVARFAGRIDDATAGTIVTNFDEVTVWQPASDQLGNPKATGSSWLTEVGTRAFNGNCQLVSQDGELLVDVVNVRALLYKAVILHGNNIQKEPYAGLVVKRDPDYIHSDMAELPLPTSLAGLVDLYIHKKASIKILTLDDHMATVIFEAFPTADITLALYEDSSDSTQFKFIRLDLDSDSQVLEASNRYDLIVGSQMTLPHPKLFQSVYGLLDDSGTFIIESTQALDNLEASLQLAGFQHKRRTKIKSESSTATILLSTVNKKPYTNGEVSTSTNRNVLLVYRVHPPPLISVLESLCTANGWNVRKSALANAMYQPDDYVIMLAELEEPLLAILQDEDLRTIQNLTENTRAMIWITGGSLLEKSNPEFSMALGWSRVLRLEKSYLDLVTLDFDYGKSTDSMASKVVFDILDRQSHGTPGETEYFIDRNSVHIGRLIPNKEINETFIPDSTKPQLSSPREGEEFKGILEEGKICFLNDPRAGQSLSSDSVEIEVKAVGINEQDSLVVSGLDDSKYFSHEIVGTITRVSEDCLDHKVGDRVVAFSFNTLSTKQQTDARFVQQIADAPFDAAATIPTAFCTAIYGLHDLAAMEKGDVVLILDGCGSPGLAALQLCFNAQAKAVIVTDVESTIERLLEMGLPRDQIISPGDEDIIYQIQRLTKGRGPDIIFASQSCDSSYLIDCGRILAPFGRIIIFGRQRGTSLPSLSDLARGCSVFSYDLYDLYRERPQILSRLLRKCIELYTEKKISAIGPLSKREPSEVDKVFSSVSHNIGDGKTIFQYQSTSLFKVLPKPPQVSLNPDASYLLVGCLGGLGRSLSSWMVERGARHLTFLSRSGTDNPSALALVESLRARGVHVIVLRADVTSKPDLSKAIASLDSKYPIRGVIHAAMVLKDKLFQNMNIESWRQVQDPKVKGCLNLHEIFSRPNELDFFVMTSSIAASLGSSGQSNYAAANCFLDFLANRRRKSGLPGVSLILPMVVGVGYVADHPEIEASLRRKGLYGIDEKEMLASFGIAIEPRCGVDHIICGMDPSNLAKAISSTDTNVTWHLEARLSTILRRMESQITRDDGANQKSILVQIENLTEKQKVVDIISDHLVHGLSTVLMINTDDINTNNRSIASYGLDSMIGAEYRNWVFKEFKVDIPFQQLLANSLTIIGFAEILHDKIKTTDK